MVSGKGAISFLPITLLIADRLLKFLHLYTFSNEMTKYPITP